MSDNQKRQYAKLWWGEYVGYFETPEQANDALPRLGEQMEKDGAIAYVDEEYTTPLGIKQTRRLLSKWPEGELTPTMEVVEMTPKEYFAIPACNNWVAK